MSNNETERPHTGARLLNWSAQWTLVLAAALLVPIYVGQWIIYDKVTMAPAYWVAGIAAVGLVQAWAGWLKDGSFSSKKRT